MRGEFGASFLSFFFFFSLLVLSMSPMVGYIRFGGIEVSSWQFEVSNVVGNFLIFGKCVKSE